MKGKFERIYQDWFTESFQVVKQLIPDRLKEFDELYKADAKRKIIDSTNYSIQDWLNGIRSGKTYDGINKFDDFGITFMRFRMQMGILTATKKRFNTSLFDIKNLVQADLFDSEIASTKELLKKGFSRAAGVICGVIIEKHLFQVCLNHNIVLKKSSTISDINDSLKSNEVIEMITWRFIQHLGDIRNLCSHNKGKEPAIENVEELIIGTEKIIKTVF